MKDTATKSKVEKPKEEKPEDKKKEKYKYPVTEEKPFIIHDSSCKYPESPEETDEIAERQRGGNKDKEPNIGGTARVELKKLRPVPRVQLSDPEQVVQFLKGMEDYDRENAKVLYLDTKNRLLGIEDIGIGTINSTALHSREAVKGAVLQSATYVIFVHNHPSGNPQPSKEDTEFTKKLVNAFSLMDIDITDSIIIGKEGFYSYRQNNMIPRPSSSISAVLDVAADGEKDEACKLAMLASREVLDEKCHHAES